MLIVTVLLNFSQEHRSHWLYLVVLVGGTLMGLLSWHLIERPAMYFARNKTKQRSRTAACEPVGITAAIAGSAHQLEPNLQSEYDEHEK
jgi:peptidoglycan/LPS O-acetylase OafA/YrhL